MPARAQGLAIVGGDQLPRRLRCYTNYPLQALTQGTTSSVEQPVAHRRRYIHHTYVHRCQPAPLRRSITLQGLPSKTPACAPLTVVLSPCHAIPALFLLPGKKGRRNFCCPQACAAVGRRCPPPPPTLSFPLPIYLAFIVSSK